MQNCQIKDKNLNASMQNCEIKDKNLNPSMQNCEIKEKYRNLVRMKHQNPCSRVLIKRKPRLRNNGIKIKEKEYPLAFK